MRKDIEELLILFNDLMEITDHYYLFGYGDRINNAKEKWESKLRELNKLNDRINEDPYVSSLNINL